jgi:hypothetical protein
VATRLGQICKLFQRLELKSRPSGMVDPVAGPRRLA